MILTCVVPPNVKFLMINEKFTIIMILLHYRIQVKIPTAKIKRTRTLNKVLTKIWENASVSAQSAAGVPECIEKYLKASDFVKALVEARRSKEITMNQLKVTLVRFMIDLQEFLDFEEIF